MEILIQCFVCVSGSLLVSFRVHIIIYEREWHFFVRKKKKRKTSNDSQTSTQTFSFILLQTFSQYLSNWIRCSLSHLIDDFGF